MSTRRILGVTVLLAWVMLGHARVLVWHDGLTLWADAYAHAHTKGRVVINFARMLQDYGDPNDPRILPLYDEGIRLAQATSGISGAQQRDWHALAIANEARYWRLHGDLPQAERLARQAVNLVPLPFARAEFVRAYLVRHCTPEGSTWRCPPVPVSP